MRGISIWSAAVLSISVASLAWAGMPSVGFSEMASFRLQGISFFLLVLLVSSLAIQNLWNWIANDFTRLPRLSYRRGVGIVVLWGLLFIIVLTMISGARELMTPGAWEKRGVTYRLANGKTSQTAAVSAAVADEVNVRQMAERRLKLAELRHQLYQYAVQHDGQFPESRESSDFRIDYWQLPDISGMRYVFVSGRTTADVGLPLAYESEMFDGDPLVLMVGGEIVLLSRNRLEESVAKLAVKP